MAELLPVEKWQLVPYRWGLMKVLIGTDENGVPHYEVLSRGHPWDRPAETTVLYKYRGDDETRVKVLLGPWPDYFPWVAGHGIITLDDVGDAFAEDERLGRLLQKIVDGQIHEVIPILTTSGAMQGIQTLPLAVLFLGDADALAQAAQEGRIEKAAERLVARGGTVAS